MVTPSRWASAPSTSHVRAGIGIPVRRRSSRERRSGSPGKSTSSNPAAGGTAFTLSSIPASVAVAASWGANAAGSSTMMNTPLP